MARAETSQELDTFIETGATIDSAEPKAKRESPPPASVSFPLHSLRRSPHCLAVKSLAAHSLALIACLHLVGGHWLALNTVAWVGMFVENQRDASLVEALEKTFDGQHPCSLCNAIEKGQQDEGEKRPAELTAKVNAVLASRIELPVPGSTAHVYFERGEVPSSLRLPRPSPPPWCA